MKSIALFGASGQSGRQFLELALEKGHRIKALVRSPEKIGIKHPNLLVIKGDVLDYADVAKTVEGTQIVVSLFGHVKDSPEWLQTNGTKHIVEAMKKYRVGRIISLSGGGLPDPVNDKPKIFDYFMRLAMKILIPKVLNDAKKHLEVLKNSGLKWMVVRAPMLNNEPKKGNYKVSFVGIHTGMKLSRQDLADFIVKQLEDEKYNYQLPFVSY